MNLIQLTIVSDIEGSTRGENGENTGIIEVSGGTVFDLKVDGEDEHAFIDYQLNGRVIHLRIVDR